MGRLALFLASAPSKSKMRRHIIIEQDVSPSEGLGIPASVSFGDDNVCYTRAPTCLCGDRSVGVNHSVTRRVCFCRGRQCTVHGQTHWLGVSLFVLSLLFTNIKRIRAWLNPVSNLAFIRTRLSQLPVFIIIIIIIIIHFYARYLQLHTHTHTQNKPRLYSIHCCSHSVATIYGTCNDISIYKHFHISTSRNMCAARNMAVFCSSLISCFPGMLLR